MQAFEKKLQLWTHHNRYDQQYISQAKWLWLKRRLNAWYFTQLLWQTTNVQKTEKHGCYISDNNQEEKEASKRCCTTNGGHKNTIIIDRTESTQL